MAFDFGFCNIQNRFKNSKQGFRKVVGNVDLELSYVFVLGAIISGVMVISAVDPVHAALWLILAFVNVSAVLLLLEVEFVALILVIVYVGAIVILFLFVIMMMDLTIVPVKEDLSNYLPASVLIGVIFLFETYLFRNAIGGGGDSFQLESNSNIEVLGRVLYTEYSGTFILASLILLISLIGTMALYRSQN